MIQEPIEDPVIGSDLGLDDDESALGVEPQEVDRITARGGLADIKDPHPFFQAFRRPLEVGEELIRPFQLDPDQRF